MTKEKWKPIKGYTNFYQVSNLGNVRSIDRIIHQIAFGGSLAKRTIKGRNMILAKDKDGYIRLDLSKNGKAIHKQVHRLVANAFVSNPKNKPCVNHKDGNKTNNNANNLEWTTVKENTHHAAKNGIHANMRQGKKLSLPQRKELANRFSKGENRTKLAQEYNINVSYIYDILKTLGTWKNTKRKTWKQRDKKNDASRRQDPSYRPRESRDDQLPCWSWNH